MATEEGKEEGKKGSMLIKIIILVVILGVLGGGGFFGYVKFFKQPTSDAAPQKHEEKALYEMDTFLVNLADAGGKRYLKVNMKLEVTGAQLVTELNARGFEVRDSILTLLSSKEFDDISTTAGKASLKQEIMGELNRSLKQGKVKEIYFTDFIVQ